MPIPDRDKVCAEILETLKGRMQNHGLRPGDASKKCLTFEVDFLTGAMAALQAMAPRDDSKLSDMVPPRWVFCAIRGESVFAEDKPKEGG